MNQSQASRRQAAHLLPAAIELSSRPPTCLGILATSRESRSPRIASDSWPSPAQGGTQQEWVELDTTGKLTGHWRLDDLDAHCAGLTTDGHVFVQKGWGREIYALDRATGSWKPASSPMPNGYFFGVEGNELVLTAAGERAAATVLVRSTGTAPLIALPSVDSMLDFTDEVPGAAELMAWFGRWFSFHMPMYSLSRGHVEMKT